MSGRRWPGRCLLPLILLLLAGCGTRVATGDPVAFSYHTQESIERVHIVAMIPLYHGPEVDDSAITVDAAMATALRELGPFQVRELTTAERDLAFGDPARNLANVTVESLRTFRVRHRADALLVGRIDHYDSYDPMSVGLEAHLISCSDGATLWSATGHFDGRRRDIQREIHNWHRYVVGQGLETIGGWQLVLQSPSLFTRYVCDTLVNTMLLDAAQQNRRLRYVR